MTQHSEKNIRFIKLTLEYDGSDFSGWQLQPNCRTVQREIEIALKALIHEDVRVVGAGRTDAGVHALGQVVSFRTQNLLSLSAFERGLNVFLPEDVRVVRTEEMDRPFDARRHAVGRTYRYVISKQHRVVGRQYAWYPRMVVSLEPMRRAAEYLLGEHDFTSFCKSNSSSDNVVSRVSDVRWDETDEDLRFEITAVRFFRHMVRIIVGTLLEVGCGKISPEEIKEIIGARDRSRAGPTVPSRGLFLVRVDYDVVNF